MDNLVDVTIPVEPEVAKALESPARRDAAGRVLSGLLKSGRLREVLGEAIADAKREARANGLTDEDIDKELQAWRAESRDRSSSSTHRRSFRPHSMGVVS